MVETNDELVKPEGADSNHMPRTLVAPVPVPTHEDFGDDAASMNPDTTESNTAGHIDSTETFAIATRRVPRPLQWLNDFESGEVFQKMKIL
ncbi:unnamed protein product, partial [Ilex paraguariensis]